MDNKWDKTDKTEDDNELAKIESTSVDVSGVSSDINVPVTVAKSDITLDKKDGPEKTKDLPPSVQRILNPSSVVDEAPSARGFLFAYITSVFSSFALLAGVAFLGYALFNHFFNQPAPDEPELFFYFDPAPFYLSVMASLLVFGVLYLFTSRYAAHSVANNTVSERDWRIYRIVYALFAAYIIAAGASVLASILYIPLGHALIAEDMTSKQITVLVLGSLHVLLWIALLVWQERLVRHGKESMIHGTIVAVAAMVIIILVGVFPVGSKTNDRIDHRTTTDLETIERKIGAYASDAKGELPTNLGQLKFNDSPIKDRLSKYRYTIKPSQKQAAASTAYDYDDLAETVSDGVSADESKALMDLYKSSSSNSSTSTKKTYELCATFKTDTTAKTRPDSIFDSLSSVAAQTKTTVADDFDRHKTGEVCFERSTYDY